MTIEENIDLKPYNTFGLSAIAKNFTVLQSTEDAITLLRSDLFQREKHLFLGGGSNILLTKDFDGIIAKVEIKGIKVVHEDNDAVTLEVGAGENWHNFVMYCVARNWGGVENLSLIPGTVGAAPMQNIGAYGVEVKRNILSVRAIDINSGKTKSFTNLECRFGYRESIFKQEARDKYLITGVSMLLTKKNHEFNTSYGAINETLRKQGIDHPTIKEVSNAVIDIRRSKLPDPVQIGNAGSFFKNPTVDTVIHDAIKSQFPTLPSYPSAEGTYKIPAAWLIEQSGWKGKTFDNIGVHQHQALVLVNYGGGKGEKIWALAMEIQKSVQDKFNITLTPEVNVV